jgi:hypothetical protein
MKWMLAIIPLCLALGVSSGCGDGSETRIDVVENAIAGEHEVRDSSLDRDFAITPVADACPAQIVARSLVAAARGEPTTCFGDTCCMLTSHRTTCCWPR